VDHPTFDFLIGKDEKRRRVQVERRFQLRRGLGQNAHGRALEEGFTKVPLGQFSGLSVTRQLTGGFQAIPKYWATFGG